MEECRRRLRLEPLRLKRLRNAFYKKGLGVEEALEQLPDEVRVEFGEAVEFGAVELECRQDSKLDGASKLLFRTVGGHGIESVILRIASGRTSLCISSQAGCAARCSFCATGRAEAVHNLSVAEILDQVVQANRLLLGEGRRVRNVVFMGMGEPFHNEANLHRALEVLSDPRCFNYSQRKLLVSTVGVPEAMVRFAERFPGVNLALSLHSARQDVREGIMPIAKVHSLAELRVALERVAALQEQNIMVEYLMLKGINDRPADLEALQSYLHGLPVHINLIAYNPVGFGTDLEGCCRPEREAFGSALRQAGFEVTLRYSLGADIAAACGQLARQPLPG